MSQPPGFIDQDRPSFVCRLRKPIYGLKQASRAWYISLKHHLLDNGFTSSLAYTSLLINSDGNTITYSLVYVEDIIVIDNNEHRISQVLNNLADRFSIKDPTNLHCFLGVKVTRSASISILCKGNMWLASLLNTTCPTQNR